MKFSLTLVVKSEKSGEEYLFSGRMCSSGEDICIWTIFDISFNKDSESEKINDFIVGMVDRDEAEQHFKRKCLEKVVILESEILTGNEGRLFDSQIKPQLVIEIIGEKWNIRPFTFESTPIKEESNSAM